jgi:hypothetical protein
MLHMHCTCSLVIQHSQANYAIVVLCMQHDQQRYERVNSRRDVLGCDIDPIRLSYT